MKLSCQENLVPGSNFAEKIRKIKAYGFEGVELSGTNLLDPAGLAERRAVLKGSSIHASSICGGFPCELVHPEKVRRQKCVDTIKRLMDIAAEVGAAGPISVPIFNGNDRIPDLSPYKTRNQLEKELLVDVLREVAQHGEEVGASLLLEPLNRYETDALCKAGEGAEICRALNSLGVKLMADFFHMHIEEKTIPDALRGVGDVLAHIHLADSTRLEPGSGSTDFTGSFAALKEIGFTGYMAFECGLSGPAEQVLPRSVAYLRRCMEV